MGTSPVKGHAPAREANPAPSSPSPGFEAVYWEYFPFVWRCLLALGVTRSGLDDAAQDVFVIVHRKLPTFRGDSTMRTWIYSIVRNVAANHRRSARRKGPLVEVDTELPSDAPTPHDLVESRRASDLVQAFMRSLDESKRELFMLVALEEMSIAEAAGALSMPLNTAYTRWRTLRLKFQEVMTKRGSHNG